MAERLVFVSYYVLIAAQAVACAAGWVTFRKLTKALRLLFYLICVTLFLNILSYVVGLHWHSNIWIFHLSTLVEYSFLAYLFSYWQDQSWARKTLRFSVPGFAVIWIISKIWLENWSQIDNYTSSLSNALLIGISAYTFLRLVLESKIPIVTDPRFWVCSAVLVYYAGTLLTFAFSRILLGISSQVNVPIWIIHNLMAIIAYLLYTRGFLFQRQS